MTYDCVVLGVGGIGSAALLAAAQRGWKVLGIERFGSAHDRGSSHGQTRMIRTAYFEHPNYVPLARRAWQKWHQLQSCADVPLIQQTGLLQVGDPDGEIIGGVRESARLHEIAIEELTPAETMQRFPALKIAADMDCVYEQMAGFLRVENCIAFMIKQAKFAGAEFAANTAVDGLDVKKDKTIVVYADGSSIKTQRLIICLGAWSKQLLDQLPFKLDILRKQQHWFQIDRHDVKWENGFPGFLIETGGGWFYGFPEVDHLGMKVAEHSGGRRIEAADSVNRECDAEELARTQQFFRDTFQFTRIRLVHYSVCMYSMSSDGHFMIDRHPECGQIVFVAGLSGHGFKFSPVIGDYLVELLEGRPDPLFQFFCLAGRDLSV